MKISVIIPYNKDRGFLDLAIKSFDKQDYSNKEMIVSHSDNKVGFNLNRGIEKSTGDLITYLCDDDLLPLNALEYYAKSFDGDFCHGNAYSLKGYNMFDVIPEIKKPTLLDMLISNRLNGGTVCYHASVFDKYGLFDESLWTAEEYDFNMMIMSKGAEIGYIDQFLYTYRRHNAQKSSGDVLHQARRLIEINKIRKRYL